MIIPLLLLVFLFQILITLPRYVCAAVVQQIWDVDFHKAYVIRGNAAILKCDIPSFVADFVEVVSWHTDQDETFYPNENYGSFFSWKIE